MSDFIINRSTFFIFVILISLIIVWILCGMHEDGGKKNWNFADIHGRQKKLEPPSAQAGPSSEFRPSAGTEARGPSLGTR